MRAYVAGKRHDQLWSEQFNTFSVADRPGRVAVSSPLRRIAPVIDLMTASPLLGPQIGATPFAGTGGQFSDPEVAQHGFDPVNIVVVTPPAGRGTADMLQAAREHGYTDDQLLVVTDAD